MRRLLPLLVLLAIPFPSAALADGCPPSTCGTTSVAPVGSKPRVRLSERAAGAAPGLRLADRSQAIRASRAACSPPTAGSSFQPSRRHRKTRFVRYETRTGRGRALRTVPGVWSVVGVSADGRRIARFKFRKRARATVLTLDESGRTEFGSIPQHIRARVVLAGRPAPVPRPLAPDRELRPTAVRQEARAPQPDATG